MSLSADTLLDRTRLKHQLTKWRIIAVIIALIAALIAFDKFAKFSPVKSDYIARITIDGIITDDPKLTKLIQETADDSHAKAAIIWLDTPGGSAVGGQQLYLDLRKLSETKPTVAVMRSEAASAGYMAALGADRIFAREGTITGSIGVILQAFEFTELAQKLGVKPITIKSGPYKASPNPFEKYTEAQDEVLQSAIKDFFGWFVDIVAERRHLPRDRVVTLADGRIYTGRQALETKLIDELGGEDEAKAWLVKNKGLSSHIDIEDVKVESEDQSLFEQLTQLANGKFGSSMLQRLDGLNAIWQPNSL